MKSDVAIGLKRVAIRVQLEERPPEQVSSTAGSQYQGSRPGLMDDLLASEPSEDRPVPHLSECPSILQAV